MSPQTPQEILYALQVLGQLLLVPNTDAESQIREKIQELIKKL